MQTTASNECIITHATVPSPARNKNSTSLLSSPMMAIGGSVAPMPKWRAPTTRAVPTRGSTRRRDTVAPTRHLQGMVVIPGPAKRQASMKGKWCTNRGARRDTVAPTRHLQGMVVIPGPAKRQASMKGIRCIRCNTGTPCQGVLEHPASPCCDSENFRAVPCVAKNYFVLSRGVRVLWANAQPAPAQPAPATSSTAAAIGAAAAGAKVAADSAAEAAHVLKQAQRQCLQAQRGGSRRQQQ
eukprot:1161023-Pelagomonas_calceolata.AAC.6